MKLEVKDIDTYNAEGIMIPGAVDGTIKIYFQKSTTGEPVLMFDTSNMYSNGTPIFGIKMHWLKNIIEAFENVYTGIML